MSANEVTRTERLVKERVGDEILDVLVVLPIVTERAMDVADAEDAEHRVGRSPDGWIRILAQVEIDRIHIAASSRVPCLKYLIPRNGIFSQVVRRIVTSLVCRMDVLVRAIGPTRQEELLDQ